MTGPRGWIYTTSRDMTGAGGGGVRASRVHPLYIHQELFGAGLEEW